jgi:hypothetical protein
MIAAFTKPGPERRTEANLALAVARDFEEALVQFEHFFLGFRLENRKASNEFLGFGEGSVFLP